MLVRRAGPIIGARPDAARLAAAARAAAARTADYLAAHDFFFSGQSGMSADNIRSDQPTTNHSPLSREGNAGSKYPNGGPSAPLLESYVFPYLLPSPDPYQRLTARSELGLAAALAEKR